MPARDFFYKLTTTLNIPSVSVGIGSVWVELSGSFFSGVCTAPANGNSINHLEIVGQVWADSYCMPNTHH